PRDDGRDALVLEPAEQAAQFRTQDRGIRETREKRFDGVERYAFGADRIDGVRQSNEQALKVVLAGLLDLAALHGDEVDGQKAPADEVIQVETQRRDVTF